MRGTRLARGVDPAGLANQLVPFDARAEELARPALRARPPGTARCRCPGRSCTIALMISTFSVSITMVGSICSLAEEPVDHCRVPSRPRTARTAGRRDPSATTRFRRASGCVGVVISSSSSRSTGTVTRSDSSTGSVSRPASTRPARISCDRPAGGGDSQPHVELRMDAAQVFQQRREHVQAHRHAARQPQRAAQARACDR